jgi:hypothetical protein
VRAQPRDGTRGRPGPEARPAQGVHQIDGALAAVLTARQARIAQHGCVIVATKELDTTPLPSPAVLAGDKGQVHAARGCRCVKDPPCVASALSLKTPARLMALMIMTGCLLASAAWDDRLRKALQDHEATLPNQPGKRRHHPTARWRFPAWVGIHVRCQAGPWPLVLHRTADPQHWLRLLGQPDRWPDDVPYV